MTTPKYINIFCLLLFGFCNSLFSQEFSVQLAPGLINYGGDLQNKLYTVSQGGLSIYAGVTYRIDHISVKGGFTYGKIKGSDAANGLYETRNLSFETAISEVNLALQYDLFLLNEKKFTPYVFAGVGLFHFDPYTFYNSEKVYLRPLSTEGQGLSVYPDKKAYSLTQFTAPLGIGVKYKLSERIQVGIEFCSRLLFTDYIDDVSEIYPDENALLKERGQLAVDLSFRGDETNPSATFPSGMPRGNPDQNDNYYTSQVSFIYVFPKQGLFGGLGSSQGKKSHAVDCPKL